MKAIVEIEGMEIFAFHGVFPEEKKNGQLFRVDGLFRYDAGVASQSDEIADAMDYTLICRLIEDEMRIPSSLLEHVAYRIIRRLKMEILLLEYIRITITKLKPPITTKLSGIRVTLEEGL